MFHQIAVVHLSEGNKPTAFKGSVMDTVEKEATGFAILIAIICAVFVAVTQTGCGNTRFYIGVDDYGEAKEFHHDFKTRGNGDGISANRKGA